MTADVSRRGRAPDAATGRAEGARPARQRDGDLPAPLDPGRPYRVGFVCTGNICRSPMAAVVLRAELDRRGLAAAVAVDGRATSSWEVGNPMDPRAVRTLRAAGYDPGTHAARQIDAGWLAAHDLVLGMDAGHLADLRGLAARRGGDADRIRLLGCFDPARAIARPDDPPEISDPWYGDQDDFAAALTLIEAAVTPLADRLALRLAAPGEHLAG